MSVLVVGLSHKSAPVSLLERASIGGDPLGKLIDDIVRLPDVAETFVISTCNRVEVYAEIDRFHGAVNGVTELLARHSGIPADELTPSLYVHYEDRAVQHLLAVASGLESMVVGEDQILGQVRGALKLAETRGTLGRALRDLGRTALRAGKRARAEAGIDRLGLSLVSIGTELAAAKLSITPNGPALLSSAQVLVVGAGAMSGLAVATAARSGAARIMVANRTRKKAERLAAAVSEYAPGAGLAAGSAGLAHRPAGEAVGFDDLPAAIAEADLVISCTGAAGVVVTETMIRSVLDGREPGRALVMLDLAMPRDVDPAVAGLPGAHVIGLEDLRGSGGSAVGEAEVAAARRIVEEEFAAYTSAVRAAGVTPTVVALRAKAATVVDAELARLAGRLTDESLSGHALDEIARTVNRVVDKLLHAPTVRVKELASSPGGEEYATALRVLFDLDPRAVEAVTHAEVEAPGASGQEGAI